MYTSQSKERVIEFIKSRGRTYQKEIIKLGTAHNRIDQNTVREILKDLEKEELIKMYRLGNMLVIEWV